MPRGLCPFVVCEVVRRRRSCRQCEEGNERLLLLSSFTGLLRGTFVELLVDKNHPDFLCLCDVVWSLIFSIRTTLFFRLTRHLLDTYSTLSRHLLDTYWTLTRHLLDTYSTLTRHLLDTYSTLTQHLRETRKKNFLVILIFLVITSVYAFLLLKNIGGIRRDQRHRTYSNSPFLAFRKTVLFLEHVAKTSRQPASSRYVPFTQLSFFIDQQWDTIIRIKLMIFFRT